MSRNNLLDLNVLVALIEPDHVHHQKAQGWFNSSRKGVFSLCPLTEAGFLRVTANPGFRPGPRTMPQAIAILQAFKGHPDHLYLSIEKSWVEVTAGFARRIVGHQQVTDAYLLGLAIRENGVLVTFDKGILHLAGPEFSRNVFVIE
jgi:toxin-antitoxin system PIN domain toxin